MPHKIMFFFFLFFLIFTAYSYIFAEASQNKNSIGVAFANMILKEWSDPTKITDKGWEYNNSIVLYGIEKIYRNTKDKRYLDYIKKWVDSYIDSEGNITFKNEMNNLDYIHPGLLLFFLYEETNEEKYKKAAFNLKKRLLAHPRNSLGGFWHKDVYPHEMWLDGIYMAEPFLVKYGYLFGEAESCNNEATFQTLLIAEKTQSLETGLLYHAWDEDKNAIWANKENGRSNFVWLRAMGWYLMAIVDILDYLPKEDKSYQKLVQILNRAIDGLKKYQDKKSGLWYQVVDKNSDKSNWLETSGSAMVVYTIKKAVSKGYIDKENLKVAEKAWLGLKKQISFDDNGVITINNAVEGMGVQPTLQGYIYKRRLTNSTHGLCSILLASSVMEF